MLLVAVAVDSSASNELKGSLHHLDQLRKLHDDGEHLRGKQMGHCTELQDLKDCLDHLLEVQTGLSRLPVNSATVPAKVGVDRPLMGAEIDCSNRRLFVHQKIQLDMV